jgi:cephalosporin hydroxylase
MSNFVSRTIKRLTRGRQKEPERVRLGCRSADEYRDALDMTLREWFMYHQNHIALDRCSWMGVRAIKNPLDAWIYQEIIYELKPDVIVEIGSYEGGGSLFLASMLDLIGKGMVISIDTDPSKFRARHERIRQIAGSSSSEEVVDEVRSLCEGKVVMVIHDGDHRKEQVLRDLRAYAPLVPVGSYLIVEDGNSDLFEPGDGLGLKEDGPLAAVEQFLADNLDFEADPERERYILTYNPRGFLRRIR